MNNREQSGSYNLRIVIQSPTQETESGQVGVGTVWTETLKAWAKKESAYGSKTKAAVEQVGISARVLKVRYRSEIQVFQRVIHGGETFEIVSVEPDDFKQNLFLTIRSVNADTVP